MSNTTPIKFHYFTLSFTPYKDGESKYSSNNILKECINRINRERTEEQKAIVIDRHENRDEIESRNLFVSSAAYKLEDKLFKCRIALLRDNKIPTLVNKSDYNLTPLDYLKGKAIAETTNFYIDLNGNEPVICCEYNNLGPRISDIEFYFRYISSNKMLYISKACKAAVHMELPVEDVLQSMQDVYKIKIKAKPERLSYLYQNVEDAFITNMNALAGTINPATVKIDLSFRERGTGKEIITKKNQSALSFSRKVLSAVKNDSKVIDDFEDFQLEFEKEDGSDGFFNLVKGKKEFQVHCLYSTPGHLDTRHLYEEVRKEFKTYLKRSQ